MGDVFMLKKIIIGIVILIVIIGILSAVFSGKPKGESVTWVAVKRGDIVNKALAMGKIEPKKEISIKSQIAGIVKKIFVEVGDKVQEGSPLIEINPNPTPLEYADAKRQVALAQIDMEDCRSKFERSKSLCEKSLVCQEEFETSKKNFQESELRYKLAFEKLSLIEGGKVTIADKDIESIIRSPMPGIILERLINEGDSVVPLTSWQPGTGLMTLADMGNLIFRGMVDEIDVGFLQENMEASIEIGALAGKKINGKIIRIAPKAVKVGEATKFNIEIEIVQQANVNIRAGYSANAHVIINQKENVLSIPERLVEFKDDKTFVEVRGQNKDGSIVKKEIKVGLSDGINIEVLEGLKEGEEIAERPPKEIK
jgi:HlyD family secretion protein